MSAAFKSWGDNPDFLFFGGNSELRGYEYLEFIGHKAFFGNVELRIPAGGGDADAAGRAGWHSRHRCSSTLAPRASTASRSRRGPPRTRAVTPIIVDYTFNPVTGIFDPVTGPAYVVSGFRLIDGGPPTDSASRASSSASRCTSTGRGRRCSTRARRTCSLRSVGGSQAFRKAKFSFWIGYDF